MRTVSRLSKVNLLCTAVFVITLKMVRRMVSRHELSVARNPKNKELEADNQPVVRLVATSVFSG